MNVTIFSTTNCAVCHAEMKWLDSENVPYTAITIDEDAEGMERMLEATGGTVQGTPFTVIENNGEKTSVIGFDRKKLISLLNIS